MKLIEVFPTEDTWIKNITVSSNGQRRCLLGGLLKINQMTILPARATPDMILMDQIAKERGYDDMTDLNDASETTFEIIQQVCEEFDRRKMLRG